MPAKAGTPAHAAPLETQGEAGWPENGFLFKTVELDGIAILRVADREGKFPLDSQPT